MLLVYYIKQLGNIIDSVYLYCSRNSLGVLGTIFLQTFPRIVQVMPCYVLRGSIPSGPFTQIFPPCFHHPNLCLSTTTPPLVPMPDLPERDRKSSGTFLGSGLDKIKLLNVEALAVTVLKQHLV